MAKVSDVLKLSVMRGVRVVAGEEGLFRKVEHVTVMEVPDQGTLILLTLPHRIKTRDQKIISPEPPLDLRDLHHRHMLHFPKKSLFPRHHADTPHKPQKLKAKPLIKARID